MLTVHQACSDHVARRRRARLTLAEINATRGARSIRALRNARTSQRLAELAVQSARPSRAARPHSANLTGPRAPIRSAPDDHLASLAPRLSCCPFSDPCIAGNDSYGLDRCTWIPNGNHVQEGTFLVGDMKGYL